MANFESKNLELLLKDFYDLTGIKTCLYDADGNELFFYPSKLSRFCELLRTDGGLDEKCKSCDKIAFEHCKRTKGQYSYVCHAGLWECISPIIYGSEVIGFIMLGQIKKSGAPAFCAACAELSARPSDELQEAYEALPEISDGTLRSAFRILDACAGYEVLKDFVKSKSTAIDARIKQYIYDNLAKTISVVGICSEFHLSHSEVYGIFKEYFSMTPAEYVKKERLNSACKMLKSTALPVNKIAILSGIPDYNYFSKVFKSEIGVSPTEYRRLQPKDTSEGEK